ncbi:hypothetical protein BH11MYX1_BH11MYX1_14830 [soil metagenome]
MSPDTTARFAVVLAMMGAGATRARADSSVVVTLTPAGEQLAAYLGLSVPALIQNAEDKFNGLFQTANLPSLLTAFASTTAISDRGLGVDYAVTGPSLMVGAVANGAVPTDPSLDSANVIGGFIFNFGVMAGANLERWGAPRWTVFVNGFYEAAGYKDLEGHLTTGGAHVQCRVLDGASRGLVRWIGLDVTTGLELANWKISTKQDSLAINFKVENPETGRGEHLVFQSAGVMNVEANSLTVPLEVTSGISLGGVVTLYAGGGLDLMSAKATIDVNLDGELYIRTNMEDVGHATVTASGQASPSSITAHALAGLQLEIPHANLYTQGIISPDNEGVAFGVRIMF